jgi:hypothetical protein
MEGEFEEGLRKLEELERDWGNQKVSDSEAMVHLLLWW